MEITVVCEIEGTGSVLENLFVDAHRRELRFHEVEHPLIADTEFVAQDAGSVRPEVILPAAVVVHLHRLRAAREVSDYRLGCLIAGEFTAAHLVCDVAGEGVQFVAGKRQCGLSDRRGFLRRCARSIRHNKTVYRRTTGYPDIKIVRSGLISSSSRWRGQGGDTPPAHVADPSKPATA
ncbi:hypothetical protein [Mycobacterium sp. ELW1]|uniref:hypothetical protein n=1 Tax=Mycobacterium sp. ELW1 TaxID=1547487 RepID=UPI002570771F|nr:hypothetical protein [Mycobacterium sp. ELW1]